MGTSFLKSVLIAPLLLTTIGTFQWIQAEVVFDGTVGPAGTRSGEMEIPQTQGTRVGNNLFHSFSTFNINSGESALFTGSSSISNIISRVTGTSTSTIDGALDHNMPNARFWLLNPNGIIFGQNASLPTHGAFHATTADYLLFEDGGRFGADTSLPHNRVLSVANPSAFGFIGPNPGSMTVQDSKLIVEDGTGLSLIGGDIEINGGTMAADSGDINLVSVNSAGEALITPNDVAVDTFSEGGAIRIQESVVGKIENASEDSRTGSISIQSGELMVENSEIVAYTHNSEKDTGNIDVHADQITSSNSQIKTRVSREREGQGGDISMIASEFIALGGKTRIHTRTDSREKGGNITLTTPQLSLNSGTRIISRTSSSGHGGEIIINIDTLRLSTGSRIISKVENIDTTGNCGSISIEARNALTIEGDIITATEGMGDAGNIRISAPVVDLSGNAGLNASCRLANGNGGSIILRNVGRLSLSGKSGLFASTNGKGNGGQIDIEAHAIDINDHGVISTSTDGLGNAGNITINVADTMTLHIDVLVTSIFKRPRITSIAWGPNPNALGSAGTITLNVNRLNILNGGIISTATRSNQGTSANIHITVNDLLIQSNYPHYAYSANTELENGKHLVIPAAGITSNSTRNLSGGNITVHASNQVMLLSGTINTTANGSGGGGNITLGKVTSPMGLFIIDDNSAIFARAQQGNGGNIFIFPDTFLREGSSRISADSTQGNAGVVEIDNVEQGITNSILDLNNTLIGPDLLISRTCAIDRIQQQSRLTVGGLGGFRLSPGDYIPSKMSWIATDEHRERNRAAP
jgi:filamentous hemagglutinin family protein